MDDFTYNDIRTYLTTQRKRAYRALGGKWLSQISLVVFENRGT